jgi:hypothetical protein
MLNAVDTIGLSIRHSSLGPVSIPNYGDLMIPSDGSNDPLLKGI